MARRWLITGGTGLLADYLVEACRAEGPVTTTARSGGDRRCDLSDAVATRLLLSDVAPDVIIHAAGLTDVDQCEREPNQAFVANQTTAANLAAALSSRMQLVVISTDQVYPDTPGPHAESDVAPVNIYGRSKLAGEQAALVHPTALAIRTNFFAASRRPGRRSLSDYFIRALAAREHVSLFADVFFSPLHTTTLAQTVINLVKLNINGVINVGSREGRSKADFALAIARHKNLPTETARVVELVGTARPGAARTRSSSGCVAH